MKLVWIIYRYSGGYKAMKKYTAQDFDLNGFLPYLMVRFAGRLSNALANYYEHEEGINHAQWRVLANLYQHGRLMSKQLVDFTAMDKVSVSRAVQGLLERGWITKQQHQKDSRAFYIELNAIGKRAMRRLLPKILNWEESLLSTLDKKEYAAVLRAIEKLDQQLNKQ